MPKQVSLFFGILLFVIFLGTGVYMRFYFGPENIDALTERMQIRSNHIYILYISFLNILAYNFILSDQKRIHQLLDFIFRILLIISGFLALLAFVYEHNGEVDFRPFTFFAVLLSLLGILVVLTSGFLKFLQKRRMHQE